MVSLINWFQGYSIEETKHGKRKPAFHFSRLQTEPLKLRELIKLHRHIAHYL